VFSIIISALSIAYSSATISFDSDIDPSARSSVPGFYGYIGDSNRTQVMVLMVILTASHVLLKMIACSLMLKLSQAWFLFYAIGDMVIYFVYKITRGDLR